MFEEDIEFKRFFERYNICIAGDGFRQGATHQNNRNLFVSDEGAQKINER